MARPQCTAWEAAWDAYLHLARGLLPALHDDPVDAQTLDSQLGAVALRILRYAPLWGAHGPMLVAALHSAMRLRRIGDRAELANLLRVMADRLYVLSAGPQLPRRDGRHPRTP